MTDDIEETSVELALELVEVPLDQLLAEGVLRDIPVLGTAYRVARLALSIRDQIFLAKVARLLIPVKAITDEEREAFARKLAEDRDTARKSGRGDLLILDKLDDMEKPEMVGKIFRAYIRGSIPLDDFRRLCAAIGAANVSDLKLSKVHSCSLENREPVATYGLLEKGQDHTLVGHSKLPVFV